MSGDAPDALVITGASSGIGAATARAAAAPARTLHLQGRDAQRLASVADAVRAGGATAVVHPCDLTDDDAVAAFAAALPDRLAGVVHAAGVAHLGRVDALGVDAMDAQWRLNVRAPFVLSAALLPALRSGRGHVLFVNSGAGQRARAGWGGYAASKFALRALADALREEEAPAVRVTTIYPGRTATPMQRDVRRMEGGPYDPEAYLTPEAVAAWIVHALDAPSGVDVPDVSVRPA